MNSKQMIGAILLALGLFCTITGLVFLISVYNLYLGNWWTSLLAYLWLALSITGALLIVIGADFFLASRARTTTNQRRKEIVWKQEIHAGLSVAGGLFVLIFAALYVLASTSQSTVGSYVPLVGLVSSRFEETVLGGSGLLCGIMMMVGGIMAYKKPSQRIIWGVVVLIFANLSWFGAYGGVFIGFSLGVAGAILGILWKPSSSSVSKVPNAPMSVEQQVQA